MTTRLERLTRPAPDTAITVRTGRRRVAYTFAVVGLIAAMVSLVANLVAADQVATGDEVAAAGNLAWSFGLTTTAFATIKLAIALVLTGILVRLWLRVESVKDALPGLRSSAQPKVVTGNISSPFGRAVGSADVPKPLPIHSMAKRMWAPMLAMGYMAVLVGLAVSIGWAADAASVTLAAWTQGIQFFGEGLVLAGISFLLGTILGSLREGGGEVQNALGLTVKTLKMPGTAAVFVALMAVGLIVSMVQFVLYLVVTGGSVDTAVWFAWLGPLREVGLGLLLSGIVMALVTIGNVLGFQFHRITEVVTTGN